MSSIRTRGINICRILHKNSIAKLVDATSISARID